MTEFELIIQRLDTTERLCALLVDQNRQLMRKLEVMEASQNSITIGLSDACKRLGISRGTMMNRLKKGMYPYAWRDVGGQWRFPVDKLMRYGSSGC